MSKDQVRMHGHNTPGMAHRGHEHHEDEVRLNHHEPGEANVPQVGKEATSSMRDRDQESVLGGTTATRSSTAPTPPDERDQ
jgi:hypothetical protein